MTTEEEGEDEGNIPLPMVNLFSKETFLTKMLTHGRATNYVRLQVYDRFSRIRPQLKIFLYNHINPDGE